MRPHEFHPHALRACFITKLANDPGVSTKEIMISARHCSAESSAVYQTTSRVSEANKFAALGMTVPQKRTTGTGVDLQYSDYSDSEDSYESEGEDMEFHVPTHSTQDALEYVEKDVDELEKKISERSKQFSKKRSDNFDRIVDLSTRVKKLTSIIERMQEKIDEYEEREMNRIFAEQGDELEARAYEQSRYKQHEPTTVQTTVSHHPTRSIQSTTTAKPTPTTVQTTLRHTPYESTNNYDSCRKNPNHYSHSSNTVTPFNSNKNQYSTPCNVNKYKPYNPYVKKGY